MVQPYPTGRHATAMAVAVCHHFDDLLVLASNPWYVGAMSATLVVGSHELPR